MTKEFIKHTVSLNRAYEIIFEALKSYDIHQLIEAGYQLFNLPIILTDANYQLISLFPKQEIGEPIFDTFIHNSTVDDNILSPYIKELLFNKSVHYKPFYGYDGIVKDCPRIFAEIYNDDITYGHLAIVMFDNEYDPNDLVILQKLIDAITVLMRQSMNEKINSLSPYLHTLLQDNLSSINKELAIFNIESYIQNNYILMVTPFGKDASNNAHANMKIKQIDNFFPNSISTIYRNSVITLVGNIKGNNTKNLINQFEQVHGMLEALQQSSGLSQVFTNLDEIKDRYVQAYTTAQYAIHNVSFFEEVYPNQLTAILSNACNLDLYISPAIHIIETYDKENNTELSKTLKAYLECLFDKNKTAQKLCIHRNSLTYRLNRIEEIANISLDDLMTVIGLLCSYNIVEFKRDN